MTDALDIAPNTSKKMVVMYGTLKRTTRIQTITWLNKDGNKEAEFRSISNGTVTIVQTMYNGKWCFMEKMYAHRNTYEIYGEDMVFKTFE